MPKIKLLPKEMKRLNTLKTLAKTSTNPTEVKFYHTEMNSIIINAKYR